MNANYKDYKIKKIEVNSLANICTAKIVTDDNKLIFLRHDITKGIDKLRKLFYLPYDCDINFRNNIIRNGKELYSNQNNEIEGLTFKNPVIMRFFKFVEFNNNYYPERFKLI